MRCRDKTIADGLVTTFAGFVSRITLTIRMHDEWILRWSLMETAGKEQDTREEGACYQKDPAMNGDKATHGKRKLKYDFPPVFTRRHAKAFGKSLAKTVARTKPYHPRNFGNGIAG